MTSISNLHPVLKPLQTNQTYFGNLYHYWQLVPYSERVLLHPQRHDHHLGGEHLTSIGRYGIGGDHHLHRRRISYLLGFEGMSRILLVYGL